MATIHPRTHSRIVAAAGFPAIQSATGQPYHTVYSWWRRNNIPARHWQAIVDGGYSALSELAASAAKDRAA